MEPHKHSSNHCIYHTNESLKKSRQIQYTACPVPYCFKLLSVFMNANSCAYIVARSFRHVKVIHVNAGSQICARCGGVMNWGYTWNISATMGVYMYLCSLPLECNEHTCILILCIFGLLFVWEVPLWSLGSLWLYVFGSLYTSTFSFSKVITSYGTQYILRVKLTVHLINLLHQSSPSLVSTSLN